MTSKMPVSVEITASGNATRLTWRGSGPAGGKGLVMWFILLQVFAAAVWHK